MLQFVDWRKKPFVKTKYNEKSKRAKKTTEKYIDWLVVEHDFLQ